MTFELRPATETEFPDFFRNLEDAFGFHADEDNVEDFRSATEVERTIAAVDDDQIVGTAGAYTFEVMVPGSTGEPVGVPAAGVTIVTVRATHRRRGILRSMMSHQLDDVADRGEPLALLTASESSIYRRFGYGPAVYGSSWSIATDHATLSHPSRAGGRLRLVDRAEAAEHAPRIHEQRRRHHPGAVNRSDTWWRLWFKDRPFERGGASARWYVLHEDDAGQVDGYLGYRRVRASEHGLPRGELRVDQLDGVDDEVEAALWSHLLDHDLIATVSASDRPVDEPLRWRLGDPRQIRTTSVTDQLWVRIVDVCEALTARGYRTTDRFVIEVDDPFRPDWGGRFLVEGDVDGSACTRTDADADLSMDTADLGAIYMGGVTPSALRRAGRIVEHTPGATTRADVFFGSTPQPWMTTGF